MVLTAKPYTQGKITVISGPVKSGKTEEVEGYLDALVDSGYKNGSNVQVVRHSHDDKDPEHIGKHKVTVTDLVDEIYETINPHTRTVIIVGASHYKDTNIIELADSIVRSNRNLIISGLNLDSNGIPHDYMPALMGLADEVILSKAICSMPRCGYTESNRSILEQEKYIARCTHHFHYQDSPPISETDRGSLELFLGPMYSAKSTRWKRKLQKLQAAGLKPLVFRWTNDARYGEEKTELFEPGNIMLHSGEKIPAITIGDAEDIQTYLKEYPANREIFFDETQFMKGIYNLSFKLLAKGYHIYATGLPRGFNRKPFNDVPKLMCLADTINMNYANCVVCFDPASDNQRMKKIGERKTHAHIDDPLVAVGGTENQQVQYFYEARCLKDWKLLGEPENKFHLERYSL